MNCMKKKYVLRLFPLIALLLILCLACGTTDNKTNVDYDPQTGELISPNGSDPAKSDEISIVTPEPDPHRDELDAILKRTTMLEGTTVNGVAVGGMTPDEARNAVLPTLEKAKAEMQVQVRIGDVTESFSGETIAAVDNLSDVLNEAFALVREDNGYEAVSAEVERIRTSGQDFPVLLTFDETALREQVDAFAEANDTKPVDASVAYNKAENKIDFIEDIPGRAVDREGLVASLLSAKSGDTIVAPTTESFAEVRLEDIQNKYVLRGTMTTDYHKSINNRKFNIFKGAGLISGTILHPGDTFSANGTLGVRNKANGWKVATAYVAGAHEKQYGGGVCQLSSTLYNAAVMADMKIVERRNHSMPVDYVAKGRDATINSIGNIIDFKFQNSSKSDIIIISYVDNTDYKKAGKLTMEIWGIPIIEDSDGKYDEIRIPDPKKTKTLNPTGEVEYRVDESKKPGYKKQIVKNQKGSVWQSYVEYYLNGELVERKQLDTSTYKAFSAVYIVGPEATPKPSDSPTSGPTDHTPAPSTPGPSDPDPTHAPSTPAPETPAPETPKPETPKPETPKPTDDSGDDEG